MKKKTKITLIIIVLIISFVPIFAFIDYQCLKKGKTPIFSKIRKSYHTVDINPYHEEGKLTNPTAVIYFGFGYKLVSCSFCKNKIYLMPLGIGNYPYHEVICSQKDNQNNEITTTYIFKDNLLTSIAYTQIKTENNNELLDFGCNSAFTEEINNLGNLIYTTAYNCDLEVMSENNLKLAQKNNWFYYNLNKKELLKKVKSKNKNIKCYNN